MLIGVIVLGNTTGDLLNTAGMKEHGEIDDFRPRHLGHVLLSLLRNAKVMGGIVALAVSFFSMMALLSIANLSFAVPASAASYIVETILAKVLLGERIVPLRWAGATLVAFGVLLLAV